LTVIEKSIEIKVPPENVWPLLFWDRAPEYNDMIKDVKSISEKRGEMGATYHVIADAQGRSYRYDVEMTEIVKYERLGWRSIAGDWTASGVTILEPTKAGTKITLKMDYTLPGLSNKIVDILFARREIEKGNEKALEKLKSILEK